MPKFKLLPELRFSEFKKNWTEKRFDELYSFKTTNSFSRDNLNYEKGKIKNIHYGDIHTKFNSLFDITKEEVPYINEDIDISKISEENYLQIGDLVIADASEDYNDIGKSIEVVNLNKEPVVAGLHTFLARREYDEIVNGFISFLLKTRDVRLKVMRIAQGTKVLGISTKRLSKVLFHIPEYQEQQKITLFLSKIEAYNQLLNLKKIQLEKYKTGVMQRLFSKELRFKDEQDNAFPSWEESELGKLTYKTGPKNKKSIKLPVYSINNKEGFLPQSKQFDGIDSNARGFDISLYKIVTKNTFAYNPARINVGSIGYSGSLNNVIISSLYVCFKTNSFLDDNFLFHYIKTFDFNKSVLRNVEGGVRDYLFYNNFSKIKIPLPSIKEQKKIAAFLSSIDSAIENACKEIERAEKFRKGILQKMFI